MMSPTLYYQMMSNKWSNAKGGAITVPIDPIPPRIDPNVDSGAISDPNTVPVHENTDPVISDAISEPAITDSPTIYNQTFTTNVHPPLIATANVVPIDGTNGVFVPPVYGGGGGGYGGGGGASSTGDSPKPKKKSKKILWLLLIGAGVYFMTKKSKK